MPIFEIGFPLMLEVSRSIGFGLTIASYAPSRSFACRGLICVSAIHKFGHCHKDNLEVSRKSPIVDIPEIIFHPLLRYRQLYAFRPDSH